MPIVQPLLLTDVRKWATKTIADLDELELPDALPVTRRILATMAEQERALRHVRPAATMDAVAEGVLSGRLELDAATDEALRCLQEEQRGRAAASLWTAIAGLQVRRLLPELQAEAEAFEDTLITEAYRAVGATTKALQGVPEGVESGDAAHAAGSKVAAAWAAALASHARLTRIWALAGRFRGVGLIPCVRIGDYRGGEYEAVWFHYDAPERLQRRPALRRDQLHPLARFQENVRAGAGPGLLRADQVEQMLRDAEAARDSSRRAAAAGAAGRRALTDR